MVGSSEVERRILEIRQDSEQKKKDFQASLMRMKAENRRLEAALVRQRDEAKNFNATIQIQKVCLKNEPKIISLQIF
eukprot:CAMPEP_0167770914 /NCGR_PEP_ID=MMETSP0110_2-20121227/18207_1 /TAXON_ID=629695 /ORGANISM="Gymnochlora sp., Strain CCMP2014" /LENGTH=76 /DNA_ID=CAMNT_0007660191 /DNA_START=787 /DNA_END=1017 /DNA_ORIENTATION=+